jgi:hypothetical protein
MAASEGFVSVKERLRILLACAALQFGVLSGAPMRPDEVQELMRQMNVPKLAHVLRNEDDAAD